MSNILKGEKNFEAEFLGDKKLYSSTKVDISEEYLRYGWYIVFTQENEEIFASTKKY
ncbi:hypothetical protein SH2C18_06300 [Clostridium sediminicola]|uniref:hypothetical protein n=1 Tax=Clostridium sediminicola TaxID=3114879 RepID=UPI0031F1E403